MTSKAIDAALSDPGDYHVAAGVITRGGIPWVSAHAASLCDLLAEHERRVVIRAAKYIREMAAAPAPEIVALPDLLAAAKKAQAALRAQYAHGLGLLRNDAVEALELLDAAIDRIEGRS